MDYYDYAVDSDLLDAAPEPVKASQKRGQLTPRIKARSKELLGYEVDVIELRLMPYIMHVMVNEQRLEGSKVSREEYRVLAKWHSAGYIQGDFSRLTVSLEFWGTLTELVYLGYVDIEKAGVTG